MKVRIFSREHDLSDSFNTMVEEKLSRLDKFLHEDAEAKVTLSNIRGMKKIEVLIPHNGVYVRAEDATDDYYKTLDRVSEKLEGQLRKYKTRMERKKKGESIKYSGIEEDYDVEAVPRTDTYPSITKVKKFPLKPMDEEEAVLQMEMLGHSFYVFKFMNGKTGAVYRREDGNYGLIEEE